MVRKRGLTGFVTVAVAATAVASTSGCGAPELVGAVLSEVVNDRGQEAARALMTTAVENAMAAESVSVEIRAGEGAQLQYVFADMELPSEGEESRNMAFRVDDPVLGLYDTIVYGDNAYGNGGVAYWENGGLSAADAEAAGYVGEWVLLKDQAFHFDGLFDVRDILRGADLGDAESVALHEWSSDVTTETVDGQTYSRLATAEGYEAYISLSEPIQLYKLRIPAQVVDASFTGLATITLKDWNDILPITPPADSEVVVPFGTDG